MVLMPARAEGRKAMEDSLTVAQKVRRQLQSGRRPEARELPNLLDAVRRISTRADSAKWVMRRYGLDPDDIGLALLCRVQVPGMPRIQRAPLPAPEHIGTFITQLEELARLTPVDFIGILWQQADHDPKAKAPRTVWVTPFSTDKQVETELLAYKNSLKGGGWQQ